MAIHSLKLTLNIKALIDTGTKILLMHHIINQQDNSNNHVKFTSSAHVQIGIGSRSQTLGL